MEALISFPTASEHCRKTKLTNMYSEPVYIFPRVAEMLNTLRDVPGERSVVVGVKQCLGRVGRRLACLLLLSATLLILLLVLIVPCTLLLLLLILDEEFRWDAEISMSRSGWVCTVAAAIIPSAVLQLG